MVKEKVSEKMQDVLELVRTLDDDVMKLYEGLASLYERSDDVESKFNALQEQVRQLLQVIEEK